MSLGIDEPAASRRLAALRIYQRQRGLAGSLASENGLGIQLLEEATALDPTFAAARAKLVWRYARQARSGRQQALHHARAHARRVIRADPDSWAAHFSRGSVLAAEGRRGAVDALRQAVDRRPSHVASLTDLSAHLIRLGQPDEAFAVASRALEVAPHAPDVRSHVASALIAIGEDDRAEALLRCALGGIAGLRRLAVHAALGLTRLELLTGRRERSIGRALRALELYGDEPEVERRIAALLLAAGASDAAAPIFARHARIAPGARAFVDGRTVGTCHAFVLWQRGAGDAADALFRKAIARSERRIAAGSDVSGEPYELASIHAVRGDRDVACRWLERAVDAGLRDGRSVAIDPFFAGLHSDSGFRRVLDRIERDVSRMAASVERSGLAAEMAGAADRRDRREASIARADSVLAPFGGPGAGGDRGEDRTRDYDSEGGLRVIRPAAAS